MSDIAAAVITTKVHENAQSLNLLVLRLGSRRTDIANMEADYGVVEVKATEEIDCMYTSLLPLSSKNTTH